MSDALKILVVDDSITYRTIVSTIVKELPNVLLVGTANNGRQALEKIEALQPDLVLLDIEMPEMNGLEALKEIKRLYRNIGVLMISGMNRTSADITIKALEHGALDFIPKPDHPNMQDNVRELSARLLPIVQLSLNRRQYQPVKAPPILPPLPPKPAATTSQHPTTTPVARPLPNIGQPSPSAYASPQPPTVNPQPITPAYKAPAPSMNLHAVTFKVVVIGISTGGPNALNEMIPNLPENLGAPVLIVQHMPPVFTASLADSLNKKSKLRVKEAEAGEEIVNNTVYIAPGGFHMVVESRNGAKIIGINEAPQENSCRPAVDVLFRSIPAHYGKNVLALVMTGMGSDGAKGLSVLKQSGCYSLTQSAETCVVYGMPKAVDDLRLSDEQIPLNAIAGRISQLVTKRGL
jgi:two-component system, chemotaxis family, protein-glutamate methylesterase/glutaminase